VGALESVDEGGFDDDARKTNPLEVIKKIQLGCGWVARRELKIRPRFQSNLPTGPTSALWLLAFGMHTVLECETIPGLGR